MEIGAPGGKHTLMSKHILLIFHFKVCVFTVWCVCCLTDLVARGKVLVLLTGVPFFTVQQQEVDHLFLVVTVEGKHLEID